MLGKHVNEVQVAADENECIEFLRFEGKACCRFPFPDCVQEYQKTGKVGKVPGIAKQVPPHFKDTAKSAKSSTSKSSPGAHVWSLTNLQCIFLDKIWPDDGWC